MARRHHRRHHHERHHHYPHNPNPRILGEDMADLGVKASGLALTQFVNQQFAAPIVRNVFPNQAGLMGKAVDIGTTAVSAVVAGQGGGLVSRRYRRDVQFGGFRRRQANEKWAGSGHRGAPVPPCHNQGGADGN